MKYDLLEKPLLGLDNPIHPPEGRIVEQPRFSFGFSPIGGHLRVRVGNGWQEMQFAPAV